MKKLLYILLAAATIGCSKQDNFDIASGDNQVSFTITEDATRAMSTKTTWALGDKIAIFDGDNDAANCKMYEVKSISGNDATLAPAAGVTGYVVPAASTTYTAYHYSQVETIKDKPLSDFKALSVQEDALIATSTIAANSLSGSFTFTHLYSLITLGGVKGAKVKITNGATVLLAETEEITTDTHEVFLNPVADISDCVITATIGVDAYSIPAKTTEITTWAAGTPYTYNIYTVIDIAYKDGVCEIYTAKGLEAFRQMVSTDEVTNDAVIFGAKVDEIITAATDRTKINGKLMADIDLSTVCGANVGDEGTNWSPIGTWQYKYAGTFDGNGFEVRNLYINYGNSTYQGLFGFTLNATISNLGVTGKVTLIRDYCAGIVGFAESTEINNCYNKATITNSNSNNTGGIVGYALSTIIENCHNTGNVGSSNNNSKYTGGIVGYAKETNTIENCYNIGEISGTAYTGGIVGYTDGTSSSTTTIENCYNLGDITARGSNTGGISGYNYSKGTIINCYNGGNISSISNSVGGVVGSNNGGTVVNIYNLGSVEGSQTVGGIVGYNSGQVKIGYNVGVVTATSYYGNVVGNGSATTYCYYLNTLAAGTTINGTSLSKEDMQKASFATNTLNGSVNTYNNSAEIKACKWKALLNGYPTLDFGNIPAN